MIIYLKKICIFICDIYIFCRRIYFSNETHFYIVFFWKKVFLNIFFFSASNFSFVAEDFLSTNNTYFLKNTNIFFLKKNKKNVNLILQQMNNHTQRTRTSTYQGVRNGKFSVNFA